MSVSSPCSSEYSPPLRPAMVRLGWRNFREPSEAEVAGFGALDLSDLDLGESADEAETAKGDAIGDEFEEWATWPVAETTIHFTSQAGTVTLPRQMSQEEAYARNIEHEFMYNSKKVPWNCQFREGNYDEPLAAIKRVLEPLGLWTRAKSPLIFIGDVSELVRLKADAEQYRALFLILPFISTNLKKRLGIIRGQTTYSSDTLLKLLEGTCKPFRLMDLPQELRARAYDFMGAAFAQLENLKFCEIWHSDPPISDISVRHGLLHKLSLVSHEFRSATIGRFIAFQTLEIDFFSGCGLDRTLEKLEKPLRNWRLKYLRKLHLKCGIYKGCWDEFLVTFNPGQGLKALHAQVWDYDRPNFKESDGLNEYTAMIERRKKDEQLESTGVIEFLTMDPDALRDAAWPEMWFEDEGEEINERDAYQVAYGRSFYQQLCPW